MYVHHGLANRRQCCNQFKNQFGARNVIYSGVSDNDLSMFALAGESFAPEMQKP